MTMNTVVCIRFWAVKTSYLNEGKRKRRQLKRDKLAKSLYYMCRL